MKFCLHTVILVFILWATAHPVDSPVFNRSGQVGLKESFSALTLGERRPAFFLQVDFSSDRNQINKVFEPKNGFPDEYDTIMTTLTLLALKPVFAFGITDFLDVSANIPVYFDIIDHFSPEGGFGNLELSSKIRIPFKEENVFQSALFASLDLPTAQKDAGFTPRYSWYLQKIDNRNSLDGSTAAISHKRLGNYGTGKPELSFIGAITLNTKYLLFHVNSGVKLNVDPNVENLYVLNGGIEAIPVPGLTLFVDAGSTTQFSNVRNGFLINQDHFVFCPGISIRSSGGALFTLSSDINLSANHTKMYYDNGSYGRLIISRNEPSFQISIQSGWSNFLNARDRDQDLVPDKNDKCPEDKEDLDGFEDADGCPDYDNDKDHVPDSLDKCRDVPEDFDGFEDSDGCPDNDNDKDNVSDSLDKCKDLTEDFDGFEDLDGCPDYDNDRDKVLDVNDKCPMIPEDIDGFEDSDGCPDIDNDMDGIPDSADQCPDKAGAADNKGCEAVKQEPKEIKFGRVILLNVDFGSGGTVLSGSSYSVLDDVAASLITSPQITLEIQAHTDNSGSEEFNIKLTQARAEVVKEYLVSKGVERNRLIPVGKGGSDPIADNETVSGRKINTRIEIHRIQ